MMSIVLDELTSYAVHSVLSSSPVYSAGVPNSCDVPNLSASYAILDVLAMFQLVQLSTVQVFKLVLLSLVCLLVLPSSIC